MDIQIEFTVFDVDDEGTYPKREGSYLVENEFGSFHIAFWTEIKEINFGSETHIVKRPHWVLELWGGQIIRYSTTPLTDLDW